MSDHEGSPSKKRKNFLSWEDYFMGVACLASRRSKDPDTQVGACLVNEDNVIVGVGYNGFPKGCDDDEFPWSKNSTNPLMDKKFYVCHAEMNAILNKNSCNTKGCFIYVTLFPCNECAKFIIQSGIKKIIYMSDKKSHKNKTIAAKKMLDAAGVQYSQFNPQTTEICINFGEL